MAAGQPLRSRCAQAAAALSRAAANGGSSSSTRFPALLLLLSVAGPLWLLPAHAAAGSTVKASTFAHLVSALQNAAVSEVQLAPGASIVLDTALAAAAAPIAIAAGRSIVVAGPPASPWPANATLPYYAASLDLRNFSSLVYLAANTSLTFRNIVMLNFMSTLGYDTPFVSTSAAATRAGANVTVTFDSVVRIRDVCLPLQIFQQHLTSYSRLSAVPGRQQVTLQSPFCYAAAGRVANASSSSGDVVGPVCAPEALQVSDLAANMTRPSSGQGFALIERGPGYYYCSHYVSSDCLAAAGPEQCISQLLAQVSGAAIDGATVNSDGASLTDTLLPALLVGESARLEGAGPGRARQTRLAAGRAGSNRRSLAWHWALAGADRQAGGRAGRRTHPMRHTQEHPPPQSASPNPCRRLWPQASSP